MKIVTVQRILYPFRKNITIQNILSEYTLETSLLYLNMMAGNTDSTVVRSHYGSTWNKPYNF